MKLKPTKNLRPINPRCCVTCRHYVNYKQPGDWEDFMQCERGGSCSGDTEDYLQVCDYYKAAKSK